MNTSEAIKHLEVLQEIESWRTTNSSMRKAKKRARINKAKARRRK